MSTDPSGPGATAPPDPSTEPDPPAGTNPLPPLAQPPAAPLEPVYRKQFKLTKTRPTDSNEIIQKTARVGARMKASGILPTRDELALLEDEVYAFEERAFSNESSFSKRKKMVAMVAWWQIVIKTRFAEDIERNPDEWKNKDMWVDNFVQENAPYFFAFRVGAFVLITSAMLTMLLAQGQEHTRDKRSYLHQSLYPVRMVEHTQPMHRSTLPGRDRHTCWCPIIGFWRVVRSYVQDNRRPSVSTSSLPFYFI